MGAFDMISSAMGLASGGLGSVIGGLLGGGASILGGSMQNQANSQAMQQQFFDNLALQKQAQSYDTSMANTAYQRMTADMSKAGLNPILGIASGGNPSPTSPMGSVSQPRMENVLSGAVSSALQGARASADLKTASATADLTQNNADNAQKQGPLILEQTRKASGEADAAALTPGLVQAQTGAAQAAAGASAASAAANNAAAIKTTNESNVNSWIGGSGDFWDLRTYVPAAQKLYSKFSAPPAATDTGGPSSAQQVDPADLPYISVHPSSSN